MKAGKRISTAVKVIRNAGIKRIEELKVLKKECEDDSDTFWVDAMNQQIQRSQDQVDRIGRFLSN